MKKNKLLESASGQTYNEIIVSKNIKSDVIKKSEVHTLSPLKFLITFRMTAQKAVI